MTDVESVPRRSSWCCLKVLKDQDGLGRPRTAQDAVLIDPQSEWALSLDFHLLQQYQ